MHGYAFLGAITMVLCVAAVTTVLFQWLRLPVVLGYVIAGLIIGPHVPIPLVADPEIVHTLSELGVILLMFTLGLELSVRKLLEVGVTAAITAVVETSIMIALGYGVGRLLGWTPMECVFTGAIVAISSTTIIAKVFDEQKISGRRRRVVVGVLVVEDLIAIVLMTTLTAMSAGTGVSAGGLALTTGKLIAFLAVVLGVGLLVVPRSVRAIVKLGRPEITVISAVGLCFFVALLAHAAGYSVALGAFLAGTLVAESGEEKVVEHLVRPVRDVFAAVFFVSVGMMIEPALVARHWAAILVLSAVVVVGKTFGASLGALLGGMGTRTAVQTGMSLAQIGELSFVIAGLGISLGATGAFLYPVAASVSVLTTLLTPAMIRASGGVAGFVDRKLPRSVQTLAGRYEAWSEWLRATSSRKTRERDDGGLAELATVESTLRGLGAPVPIALSEPSRAIGATLATLDLRGVTGATVLMIQRGHDVLLPTAGEPLRAGDVLALAGSTVAIDAARVLLGASRGAGGDGSGGLHEARP